MLYAHAQQAWLYLCVCFSRSQQEHELVVVPQKILDDLIDKGYVRSSDIDSRTMDALEGLISFHIREMGY
jgi:hypothetical protein